MNKEYNMESTIACMTGYIEAVLTNEIKKGNWVEVRKALKFLIDIHSQYSPIDSSKRWVEQYKEQLDLIPTE